VYMRDYCTPQLHAPQDLRLINRRNYTRIARKYT
jgi:hypothetical protein